MNHKPLDPRPRIALPALLMLLALLLPAGASSQTAREEVRVTKRFANIQAGAQSGSDILVLVPQGTILPVIERRGPWFVVELSPKLRETGTPMRWYRGETRGFMHDSTVETSRYRLEEGWPKLPSGMTWGQVISVDMDGDGNIVVFRRAEPPILKFAPSGEYLGGMGEGAIQRAHGFDIDQQGQQVIKFSPKGEVLMALGKKGVAGDGPDTFSGPCDVTVTASGDLFVADGHGNSRVVKLSKDGTFIKAWGKKGAEPGDLNVPHSTAMDSQGRLFVADRSNNRIQIFDQDGKLLDSWTQFGSPSGLYITPDDTLYVADSGRGIAVGSARDGSVVTLIGGTAPEGVTVDAAGNVYAAEPAGEMLKKFVKR